MDVQRRPRPRISTVQEQRVLTGLYELHETLGTGGFGKVKLAKHLVTGENVAIKIINKAVLKDEYFRVIREIEILKMVDHRRICQLYQVIDTPEKLYLVMEYCTNGELFDFIMTNSRLTEDKARKYFRQVVSAVAYMHSKGIAHRDLKPENLMLDANYDIKVIDFGLAAKPKGGMSALLETSCGSPSYVAPELIANKPYLGDKADVWSLGILLYALLAGTLPFMDDNVNKLFEKIQRGKFNMPANLSRDSQILIRAMLQVEPANRISISSIVNHPWIIQKYGVPVKCNLEDPGRTTVDLGIVNALFPNDEYHRRQVCQSISQKKFDYWYATYMLGKRRYDSGKVVRLNLAAIKFAAKENDLCASLYRPPVSPTKVMGKGKLKSPNKRLFSQISFDDNDSSSSEDELFILDEDLSEALIRRREEDTYHIIPPKPVFPPKSPVRRLTPSKSLENGLPDIVMAAACAKAKSVENGLDVCFKTPLKPASKAGSLTGKKSAMKKVFGSIEKGFDRVVDILTPIKTGKKITRTGLQVRIVKTGSDVTEVDCTEPDELLKEITNILKICNCHTKMKSDFLVRATKYNGAGEAVLKLSLEVCWTGDDKLALRRKRLQGDTFAYRMLITNIMKILPFKNSFENPEHFLEQSTAVSRKLCFDQA
ncbi:maternal embryonic leucine zipper kinase-like [Paramacrobiotus metropolitanus]|uniref:maternal embryonic leucine zipper kinase-like n=1 Tax=Paramacrobiotus metropolitanus TaxID=2943436 RepID=UPI002445C3A7|nr:maternal embryonic leucine zipper kinase-like [Paramacrobiotus metropolitanus]